MVVRDAPPDHDTFSVRVRWTLRNLFRASSDECAYTQSFGLKFSCQKGSCDVRYSWIFKAIVWLDRVVFFLISQSINDLLHVCRHPKVNHLWEYDLWSSEKFSYRDSLPFVCVIGFFECVHALHWFVFMYEYHVDDHYEADPSCYQFLYRDGKNR